MGTHGGTHGGLAQFRTRLNGVKLVMNFRETGGFGLIFFSGNQMFFNLFLMVRGTGTLNFSQTSEYDVNDVATWQG